jgi:hypothetical protein
MFEVVERTAWGEDLDGGDLSAKHGGKLRAASIKQGKFGQEAGKFI